LGVIAKSVEAVVNVGQVRAIKGVGAAPDDLIEIKGLVCPIGRGWVSAKQGINERPAVRERYRLAGTNIANSPTPYRIKG
jgi:hypothetical protein